MNSLREASHPTQSAAAASSDSWEDQEEAFFGTVYSAREDDVTTTVSGRTKVVAEKLRRGTKKLRKAAGNGIVDISARVVGGISSRYPGDRDRNRVDNTLSVPDDSAPPSWFQTPVSPRSSSRPSPVPPLASNAISSLNRHLSSFVPSCVVCSALAPTHYQYHPFFPREKACASHRNAGKCCACHRFEPLPSTLHSSNANREFADLGDNGRKLCPACLRSIIADSSDATLLWSSIVEYLHSHLSLFPDQRFRSKMEQIPILIVSHDGLNDRSSAQNNHHHHTHDQTTTRGLCLYEYTYHPLSRHLSNLFTTTTSTDSPSQRNPPPLLRNVFHAVKNGMHSTRVTAILCLSGLPRDLAGSVLVHEATHAWFKLHPDYDPIHKSIPPQVEEGCCQLMAYLWLRHVEDENGVNGGRNDDEQRDYLDDGQPSDAKLRQYFRYCIETDGTDIYGEGFRKAMEVYLRSGCARALLEYVVLHQSFPT